MHRLRAVLAILTSVLPQTVAWASHDVQATALSDLFGKAPTRSSQVHPAHHTFVVWINGDADHFVTATGSASDPGTLYRGDKFDEQHVEDVARRCHDCNAVILHDQRGSAHWYTPNGPWATYLRVFSRGRQILESHVDEIDEADPRVLTQLIDSARRWFPSSELHLIYRGHSFRKTYRPGSRRIAPFDYSYPGQGYGQGVFLDSLYRAGLGRDPGSSPLASITLASCSMASLELADALTRPWAGHPAPLARYLVASEVDVLETLDAGFRLDALTQVTDSMDARQVSYLLASRLLEAFDRSKSLDTAMMEYPVTWMDLSGMREISGRWQYIARALTSLSDQKALELIIEAKVVKNVSDRYLRHLRAQGVPETALGVAAQELVIPSPFSGDLDLGLLLQAIKSNPSTRPLASPASGLEELLRSYVQVINAPSGAKKTGLIVDASDIRDRLRR